MKKKFFIGMFAFAIIFSSFSAHKDLPSNLSDNALKSKIPSQWMGFYMDYSTGTAHKVFFAVSIFDYSTILRAELDNCCNDANAHSASGTYSSGYVTNFQTTINGHTYSYTGYVTLL